jgi:hypothetical protein
LANTALRRFTGFDDNVIALYASGLTVREIRHSRRRSRRAAGVECTGASTLPHPSFVRREEKTRSPDH